MCPENAIFWTHLTKLQMLVSLRVLKIRIHCKYKKDAVFYFVSIGARQNIARAVARAHSARAASCTLKSGQNWHLYGIWHGALRARECARANKNMKIVFFIISFLYLLHHFYIYNVLVSSKLPEMRTFERISISVNFHENAISEIFQTFWKPKISKFENFHFPLNFEVLYFCEFYSCDNGQIM